VLKDDGPAIHEVLAKAGQTKKDQLNDIHHAPKLLALRYVFLVWVAFAVNSRLGLLGNSFTTVVSD
jgi:hypothetical protein